MIPSDSTQWSPPIVAGRQLPSFETVSYLEKLSLAVLSSVAIVYLIVRSFNASPAVAVREISGLRR